MKAVILRGELRDWRLVARTERSLAAAGISDVVTVPAEGERIADAIGSSPESVLLIAAGAWLSAAGRFRPPNSDAPGKALLAVGAVRDPSAGALVGSEAVQRWSRCLRRCGGDLDLRPFYHRTLPEVLCAYVNNEAAARLAGLLRGGIALQRALNRLARDASVRTVHLSSLDLAFDSQIRILQLITTIQIGGAERVALDLAEEARHQGYATAVAVFGSARRETFPEPPNFVNLSHVSSDAEARADAVAKVAREYGADIVHAHLIRAAELRAIRNRHLPVAVTLHNMPPGWPADIKTHEEPLADLCLACCRTVAEAAELTGLNVPVRTVWNGVEQGRYLPNPERFGAGSSLRAQYEIPGDAFVIAVIANPRRQKRLDRVPGILNATARALPDREVHVLFVGAAPASDDAAAAFEELQRAIEEHRCSGRLHWTGAMLDVRDALHACDVLLSTSDYEGLSIAMLEALAAGLPIVATDVGGNAEISAAVQHVQLLPVTATSAAFGTALAEIARNPPPRSLFLAASFTRYRMTRRYLDLYGTAIHRHMARTGKRRRGLWLITNNFSTGGAQSSGRRLLTSLKQAGVLVRAAVVQEHPERPTAGRTSLLNAGIKVVSVPCPEQIEPEEAVARLLDHLFDDPPETVVFWNLITSYKLLLADRLAGYRIVDVSPGEMYFTALNQYFSSPRTALPYRTPAEYGRLLHTAVVKYEAEWKSAAETLGCPIAIIPNGIPVAPPITRVPSGRLIIGTAARLSPQKRLEDLIEALHLAHSKLPPYVLRVAGGAERGSETYAVSLRRIARGLPIEWCGELADVAPFLDRLDLFVMISEPSGCPNASLEAMAHGVPVIATAVGGAVEQIVDGVTGRLTSPRDPYALAAALIDLANDGEQRARLGASGRHRAADAFSLERMVGGYMRVFGLAPISPRDRNGDQLRAGRSSCRVTEGSGSSYSYSHRRLP